ncbi:MAG: hypothetical protein SO169_04470 [Parabacteroides sp.]|nr:hypothetical protein [Parabacteroides sp.]
MSHVSCLRIPAALLPLGGGRNEEETAKEKRCQSEGTRSGSIGYFDRSSVC